MNALFTVIEETPTMIQKESTQLKRLLKTNNMSLESLKISNQSVRNRCRQLEASLEKEKARNLSLNKKLHHAAAIRCEMDDNAVRSEYQIDKLQKRNAMLSKELRTQAKHVEEQALEILKNKEQKEAWLATLEHNKAQKLELLDKIVKLEKKLQQQNRRAKKAEIIKLKLRTFLARIFEKASKLISTHAKAQFFKQKAASFSESAKLKIETTKHEINLRQASKKREMSKIKRKKYWERSQIIQN